MTPEEKATRKVAYQLIIKSLHDRDIDGALELVREYEVCRERPRGLNVNWSNYTFDLERNYCESVLAKAFDDADAESRVIANCMGKIFGTPDVNRWLPKRLKESFDEKIDRLKAERVLIRSAEIEAIRSSGGRFRGVAILAAGKCCEICLADQGLWHCERAPKLPHKNCEDGRGCRCMYVGITESMWSREPDKWGPERS